MMFDFLSDMGNYEDRCIGRYDAEWGFVSTARVSDGRQPFETAVQHRRYRDDGKMVIVEAYETEKAAQAGHSRWVAAMTAKTLPAELRDCANAGICEFGELLGANMHDVYPLRKEK
jgi:hypothetical protein